MKSIIVSLLLASPAIAGPDFRTRTPHGTDLTASHARREILPSDDVTFRHDSAALDANARAQLDTLARGLRVRTDLRIVVEGYADRTGDATYNFRLARERATAVRLHLIARGIPSDRLVLASFGESFADPAGNPLDRRVVVYASSLPAHSLSEALLAKRALRTQWTLRGTVFSEERTPPKAVQITRR